MSKRSLQWVIASAVSLSAAACVGSDDDLASAEEARGGTATFTSPGTGIEVYGQTVMDSEAVTCDSANGAAGFVSVLQCSTGKTVTVAGVAATGPISTGSFDGTGAVALGAAALWDPSASSLDLGGALVGSYVVEVGEQMPATAQEADALFDSAFGAAARYGFSLDQQRTSRTGQTLAWYTMGVRSITVSEEIPDLPEGYAFGIVWVQGKVLAVHNTGFGAWTGYAQ